MSKYTTEALHNLAKGVFKGSPAASHFYARSNGTFYNEAQYQALKDKDGLIKIENPAFAKTEKTSAPKAAAPALEGKPGKGGKGKKEAPAPEFVPE